MRLRFAVVLVASCARAGDARVPDDVHPIEVVDLHVDVGDAVHRRGLTFASPDFDANADRLLRGHVTMFVTPVFVLEAQTLPPAAVPRAFDALLRDRGPAL